MQSFSAQSAASPRSRCANGDDASKPLIEPISASPPVNAVHKEPWDSPAYEQLRKHQLLRTEWLKKDVDQLDFLEGNSTPCTNFGLRCAALLFPPAFCCMKMAEIPAGSVRKMDDGRGGFKFLGNRGHRQGIHLYCDMFVRIDKSDQPINSASDTKGLCINNGDQTIVVVPQGFVGLALDMGQPVLLPPGMHQWRSATMKFDRNIDLNQPVITMGPYTLLTVDKGYDAVTQNNGRQEVLQGGQVHLLEHRNWKFEKFISRKIQTDDLQRIEVMTGDNVLMHVGATVCWSITDVQMCAERAAETMSHRGNGNDSGTIVKLRNDVLKQAEASLSALVGKVNFSTTFSAATAVQAGQVRSTIAAPGGGPSTAVPLSAEAADAASLLFDVEKLSCAVQHANAMTERYGVDIISINIISAKPVDGALLQCLAKGAVAAAEAQQLETVAKGRAKAATIDAKGTADALKISAQAEAEAEVTRAEGSKQAASLLNEQDVAVRLATIHATGDALKGAGTSLILGHEAGAMGSMLLSNPDVTRDMLGKKKH